MEYRDGFAAGGTPDADTLGSADLEPHPAMRALVTLGTPHTPPPPEKVPGAACPLTTCGLLAADWLLAARWQQQWCAITPAARRPAGPLQPLGPSALLPATHQPAATTAAAAAATAGLLPPCRSET